MRITFTIDERKLLEAMSRRGFDNKSQWLQAVLNEQLRAHDVPEDSPMPATPVPKMRLERDESGERFIVQD